MGESKEKTVLGVIERPEDKELFVNIKKMLETFKMGHTSIQIHSFILNDVEYPTEWGKFSQAKMELLSRYERIVDAHYEIKETEIKRDISLRDAATGLHLESKLLELEAEKLTLRLASLKAGLKILLREAGEFYSVYIKYPKFHDLTPQQEYDLEAEQWARKAANNPLVFEERYGEKFLEQAWGKDEYNKFKEYRKSKVGLLPREIITLKESPKPKATPLPICPTVGQLDDERRGK